MARLDCEAGYNPTFTFIFVQKNDMAGSAVSISIICL